MIFIDIFIYHNRNLRQCKFLILRNICKIRIVFQIFLFGYNIFVLIIQLSDLIYQFGQIEGFHIDSVFLHRDFVKPNRLKGSGSGSYTSNIATLHPIYHTTDRSKVIKIFPKPFREGVNHMRFEHRKRDIILGENIRHGKLSAESISSVCKVHLPDLIRICLHKNRDSGVPKSCDRTVFICKDRH